MSIATKEPVAEKATPLSDNKKLLAWVEEVAALCDEICIISNGRVAIDDSADGIRERTGCDDLEEAFVHAIQMVKAE